MKKFLLLFVLIYIMFFLKSHISYSNVNNDNINLFKPTISGGPYHVLVVKNNGELFSWGDNYQSVLGTDSDFLKFSDDALKVMSNVESVSAEHFTSFAVDKENVLWGWGSGGISGILSKFTEEGYTKYPVKIMNNVIMVSAGETTLVIKKDNSLWGWGAYYYGQLGDGRYNKYLVDGIGDYHDKPSFHMQYETEPVKIMDDVVYALSGITNFAIKKDGSLWAWGYNENGEVGDGTRKTCIYPVKIMDDVKFIGYGYYAVKNDNSLWTWGLDNNYDKNKDSKIEKDLEKSNLQPKKIMDDVIFASELYGRQCVAVKKDGSLWTWGDNSCGKLGDGTKINRNEPVKVMDDVIYATGNFNFTYALKKDGSLWEMGSYSNYADVDEIYKPHKIMDDVMLP